MNLSFFQFSFYFFAIILSLNCSPRKNNEKLLKSIPNAVAEKNKYEGTLLESINNKLKSGENLSTEEIDHFAKNIETRGDFYNLLENYNKTACFPKEYYTFEKAAETVLANWLTYPTELDTIPSKIELIKKINFIEHDSSFTYYVLQFKTDSTHWAAKDGWMMGVVGPYFKDSKPYDWTSGTFSRFSKIKETTPEEEAEWVHKNIYWRSPDKANKIN